MGINEFLINSLKFVVFKTVVIGCGVWGGVERVDGQQPLIATRLFSRIDRYP